MATYKVPQDVEAEDKLLGPFSFRQFIYLVAAAISGFLAFGLSRIFWGLAVVPLPIMAFFLILALPLKKDQPMETYLTAIIHFWMKPRFRLWDPEGVIVNVEITAPSNVEEHLTKDFTGEEASARLRYLSQIVDSGGWASRGMASATDNLHLSDTVVAEARGAQDMMDESTGVAQNFETMITRSDTAYKDALIANMHASVASPQPTPAVQQPIAQPVAPPVAPALAAVPTPLTDWPVAAPPATPPVPPTEEPSIPVQFNPYPSAIHQKVVSPEEPAPQKQPQASSPEPISPDIIRLATNNDLSISTLAREAHRLQEQDEGEVVVSLR